MTQQTICEKLKLTQLGMSIWQGKLLLQNMFHQAPLTQDKITRAIIYILIYVWLLINNETKKKLTQLNTPIQKTVPQLWDQQQFLPVD